MGRDTLFLSPFPSLPFRSCSWTLTFFGPPRPPLTRTMSHRHMLCSDHPKSLELAQLGSFSAAESGLPRHHSIPRGSAGNVLVSQLGPVLFTRCSCVGQSTVTSLSAHLNSTQALESAFKGTSRASMSIIYPISLPFPSRFPPHFDPGPRECPAIA